jgi:hypothetical protein
MKQNLQDVLAAVAVAAVMVISALAYFGILCK